MEKILPPGIEVRKYEVRADALTERIMLLVKNGLGGLALVVLTLFVFLNARVAFWVAAGIPVAVLATIGIMIYAAVLWVAGITQGLMWREYDSQGFLVNSFIETVNAIHPEYVMRAIGGGLYLAGGLVMAYNVYRTIRGDVRKEVPMGASATAAVPAE